MLVWKGRLYVPEGFRKEVLKKEHDSKIAGHFGRERTMELITRNFYWPKLEDDVQSLLQQLRLMSKNKKSTTCQTWFITPTRTTIITMDIHIGRLHHRPTRIQWKQKYHGSSRQVYQNGSLHTNSKKRISSSSKIIPGKRMETPWTTNRCSIRQRRSIHRTFHRGLISSS